ncbi:urate oxidase [Frankia sp. Mgl5]|uniref:Uricase n=1 Tax=Parafrankia soli TaxID=2599596 RepID=A0A1S1QFG9_9ACTN|nr:MULTISPECIES: urate oxidase [Frankiaceae]ABW11678.1 Urate oxidase [Frankia sp. EAN1pec]CAI7976974.1 Uricase [Frankia sp. Hr75.2]MCK9931483.1 urate oxidase [Frankia sp. Mgl5]OHV32171.1 urate oxidase [Parafrankia soli]TCJ38695.1 urate oxidase [Parafrankia sp. BMG5.11]
MAIVLGPNQYGKAEVRLVHVDRSTPAHRITDLTVSTALRGDFTAAHTRGDNSHVLTTDTQKNVVYAFAREGGVGEIEQFASRLGRHFTTTADWITGARIEIEQHEWERITVDGREHDHSFVRSGRGTRTTVVTVEADAVHAVSGLAGLVVLRSTGSEFHGFPRDRYTTLAETSDRILATEVTARWRYLDADGMSGADFARLAAGIPRALVETFAAEHSLALQQTLHQMGEAVLTAFPEVAEIRMSMPNKHHFLVDLEPFGLDNPNTVYLAADRPYGRIEGTVRRDDVPEAPAAWYGTPGFC